jgi:hypothetical protein
LDSSIEHKSGNGSGAVEAEDGWAQGDSGPASTGRSSWTGTDGDAAWRISLGKEKRMDEEDDVWALYVSDWKEKVCLGVKWAIRKVLYVYSTCKWARRRDKRIKWQESVTG